MVYFYIPLGVVRFNTREKRTEAPLLGSDTTVCAYVHSPNLGFVFIVFLYTVS